MKHIFTIAALICSLSGFSTTITVSNLITSPAQYNNLQAACDAAQPNDTIQIYGSNTAYGALFVNKTLHLIGSGFGNTFSTFCPEIYLQPGSDGSTFSGLRINFISPNTSNNLSNYIFEFCLIEVVNLVTSFSNVIIKNCIINNGISGLVDDDGILISNNIFTVNSANAPGEVFLTNGGTFNSQPGALPVIIQNNLFLGNLNFLGSNFTMINNVFANVNEIYTTSAFPSSCWGCVFQNNLSYCSTCVLDSIDGATLSNNIENQPDPFISNLPNLFNSDFNLNASSLGNNFGTDGNDVGIFGGPFPFPAGSQYGGLLLGLPIITFFNILNPVIQENGQLQIQGTSTIPSN